MLAVFKHELKGYFHSLTAYIFGAFLLMFVGFAIAIGCFAVYMIDSSKFEGLLPDIMKKLSLFSRFETFVNGVFDLTGIVFYFTVIIFFLFLTVQSMEKMRYN